MSKKPNRQKILNLYKKAFEGERKEVLDDILNMARVYMPSFESDPYQNAYRCGARDLALRIQQIVESDIDLPQQQET